MNPSYTYLFLNNVHIGLNILVHCKMYTKVEIKQRENEYLKFLFDFSKVQKHFCSPYHGINVTVFYLFKKNFFFVFLSFQGCTRGTWGFPGPGSNRSSSCRPTPQPQQRLDLQPTERGQGPNPQPHGSQADSFPLCQNRNSLTVVQNIVLMICDSEIHRYISNFSLF